MIDEALRDVTRLTEAAIPEGNYCIVWWCLAGIFALLAVVVASRPRYYPGSIQV